MGEDGSQKEQNSGQQPSEIKEGGIGRRHFLKLLGGVAGLALAGGGVLRGITSAETRRPVDLLTTFKNVLKEQKDFIQRPDKVYDFFLHKDSSGEVTDMYIIAEGYDSKGTAAGRVLYRLSMEGESLSAPKPVATFPFTPTRVIRHGPGGLVCGDRKSNSLAMQYAPD